MEENGDGAKVTGIRDILRLKELLQKWKTISLTQKPNSTLGISPAVNRRFKDDEKWTCTCDSDDEICQSPESPHDVPKGYLAVYVGQELRRFIVPTSYLGHHLFKILLEKAEEEFGFDHRGGLTLPCDVETFKYLLKCMESHERDHLDDNHESSAATVED